MRLTVFSLDLYCTKSTWQDCACLSVRPSSFRGFYLELPSCRNDCDVIMLDSQTHCLLNYITRKTNAKELILRRQFK